MIDPEELSLKDNVIMKNGIRINKDKTSFFFIAPIFD
jgi:hypothetical protein